MHSIVKQFMKNEIIEKTIYNFNKYLNFENIEI